MAIEIVTFKEIGYNPAIDMDDLTPAQVRAEIIQLACNYLFDGQYAEFNEMDVIEAYDEIHIDWAVGTVLIPVRVLGKAIVYH